MATLIICHHTASWSVTSRRKSASRVWDLFHHDMARGSATQHATSWNWLDASETAPTTDYKWLIISNAARKNTVQKAGERNYALLGHYKPPPLFNHPGNMLWKTSCPVILVLEYYMIRVIIVIWDIVFVHISGRDVLNDKRWCQYGCMVPASRLIPV